MKLSIISPNLKAKYKKASASVTLLLPVTATLTADKTGKLSLSDMSKENKKTENVESLHQA